MKKLITMFSVILILGACNRSNKVDASKVAPPHRADSVEQDHVEVENQRSTVYTCSKHPEVIKDKPGVCPKCKRALVEVTD